jgi:hypothetical protein
MEELVLISSLFGVIQVPERQACLLSCSRNTNRGLDLQMKKSNGKNAKIVQCVS